MERSWSEGFSWSQVDSSSVKLESALRGRSQPGVSKTAKTSGTDDVHCVGEGGVRARELQ